MHELAESLTKTVTDEESKYRDAQSEHQRMEMSMQNYQDCYREWMEYQNTLRYQVLSKLEDILWTKFDSISLHFPNIDPFNRRITEHNGDGHSITGDEVTLYDEYYTEKFSLKSTDIVDFFNSIKQFVEDHCVSLAGHLNAFSAYMEQNDVSQMMGARLEEHISSQMNVASEIFDKLAIRKRFLNDLRIDYQQVCFVLFYSIIGASNGLESQDNL